MLKNAEYRVGIEESILGHKRLLTHLEKKTDGLYFELALLYQEVSAILHALSKRSSGPVLPWIEGMSWGAGPKNWETLYRTPSPNDERSDEDV